jgi:hypothetical protein
MSTRATNPYGARFVIRLVLLVVSTMAACVLAVAWLLVWGLTTRLLSSPLSVAVVFAGLFLFLVPVLVFGISSNWQRGAIVERSRVLAWTYAVSGVLEAGCIAVVIVAGFHTQPWLWVPTSAVIAGAVFFAVAMLLGRALRPLPVPPLVSADGQPILEAWTPPSQRRVPLWSPIVFGALALGAVVTWLAFRPWQDHGHGDAIRTLPAFTVTYGMAIILIGASIVYGIRSIAFMSYQRRALPPGTPARRTIARAVTRTATTTLTPTELELARRFAQATAITLPWGLLQLGLLYTGIILEQLGQVFQPYWPFGPWLIIVFVLSFGVVLVAIGVRLRRVRRFLMVNGDPTPTDVVGPQAAVATA